MVSNSVYIVAVSGGVDSVVLLHKLSVNKPEHIEYIVAHFNHGIRDDSFKDADLVKNLALKYNYKFELGTASYGQITNEETARNARYDFLRDIKLKYKANAIITAHHKDDVIETMVFNIIRGTGPRGLVGFTQSGILRPLLGKPKSELIEYAKNNNLKWNEDSTNQDIKYSRNYIRIKLLPKLNKKSDELLALRDYVRETYQDIDKLSKQLLLYTTKKDEIIRSKFVQFPYKVQKEIIISYLRKCNVEYDKQMIERAVISAKTLQPNKHIELDKKITLISKKSTIEIKVEP